MATQQISTRPGVVRRPAGPSNSTPSTETKRSGQSPEELRALPQFVNDGVVAEYDPANASTGPVTNETVTIIDAKFKIRDWKRKDGSYPDDSTPEVTMNLYFRRDGDEAEDRPYEQVYKYGNVALFAPSQDGNFVRVRPTAIREGAKPPVPRKTAPAMLFLTTLKAKGGANIIEKMRTEGAKALIGLRIDVKLGRVDGMHEKAKDILLVESINGLKPVEEKQAAPAAPATQAAAQTAAVVEQTTAVASEAEGFAEQALLDILTAEGGSVSISQVPTKLIGIEKWKSHGSRGPILKLLRDQSFFDKRNGELWAVDGTTVKGL